MRSFSKFALFLPIVLTWLCPAHIGAQTLWMSDGSGELFTLSTTDTSLTPVGNTGQGLVADITFGPNGTLYGFTAGNNPDFYSINPNTAATTIIGHLGLSFAYEGALAFAPNGTLYAGNGSNAFYDTIFTINPATGAATTIGALAGTHDINGMIVRSDGMLVGLDEDTSSLLLINPQTLAYSTLVTFPFSLGGTGGMTMVGSTGYFAADGTDSLYSFDPYSGAYHLIGTFPASIPGYTGLAAMPVPEPSVLGLLTVGFLGLAAARRRKLDSPRTHVGHQCSTR